MNPNESESSSPRQTEEIVFPWQRGWVALKSIWPQLVYISIGTIAIPQFLVSWAFSIRASQVGTQFSEAIAPGFNNTLKILEHFSSQYFAWILLAGVFGLVGYFASIALTFQSLYGYKPKLGFSLRTGIKTALPSGLIGFILLVIAGLVSLQLFLIIPSLQVFIQFLALIVSVLIIAWPIMLVESPRYPAKTLASALKLTYVRDTGTTKWSAFFTLLTYHMALLSLFSLTSLLELQVHNLDQRLHIPRSTWLASTPLFPFGYMPMLANLLSWLLISLCLGIFAVFTTTFIFDLKRAALRKISKIEVLV